MSDASAENQSEDANKIVRANFQSSYLLRYLLLAGVCLALAGWFAYDGLIGYPQAAVVAAEYETLSELEPVERQERWTEITSEKGWSKKAPEKTAEEIKDEIVGQYFWCGVNLILGIPALLFYIRSRGSWVEKTENGLKASWGQEVDFSTVSKLDKKKWREKGIAKATYKDGDASKIFVFDDFKYEREPMGIMIKALETQLSSDQIVNGISEAEYEAEKAKEAEKAAADAQDERSEEEADASTREPES